MKRILAALCLAFPLLTGGLTAPVAQAATVGFQLVVTATGGGPFDGATASGAVFWDADLVPTGPGSYAVLSRDGGNPDVTAVDPAVGLFFDIGPFTFTEADAWAPPLFTFVDGMLASISFIVNGMSTVVPLADYGVDMFSFDITSRPAITFDGNTYGVNAIVKYLAPVPLPAGLPLLLGAVGLLALLRRRKA
jgi:hypothetical protein